MGAKSLRVPSDYIESALERTVFEKLENASYTAFIPVCPGVPTVAMTLEDCTRELRSVLEDWMLLGLRLGHALPVVGGIDLNSARMEDTALARAIQEGRETEIVTRDEVFRRLR